MINFKNYKINKGNINYIYFLLKNNILLKNYKM